jgi:hypothetical protein
MAERNFVVGKNIVADNVGEITETTLTENTATTISSFLIADSDSAEFTVKVKQGSRYESLKALVLHNGTTVDLAQYGELSIAATESSFATWTTQTSNFGSTNIQSIAYGNNVWVAAGSAGQLRTSTDAVTWTTRTSNFGTTTIRSVAYGNGLWFAGGDTDGFWGQIRKSTDAITWTTVSSGDPGAYFFGAVTTVAYGNNKWVFGGYSATLRTTTDGTTWGLPDSSFGGNQTIRTAAYGNNLWVIAGNSNKLSTSTDAVTWTSRTPNFEFNDIRSVAYGNNLWVAAGTSGQLRTSTDAITWTTRTSNFELEILSVAYANNIWVAAASGGQIRTSTDAVTWTTRTSNFGNTRITSVAYGNSLWVAGGYTGQIRSSTGFSSASVTVPLTLSADISGSDVRLRATITDAATTNASVKVLKTMI